jgi:hypothetical protein
VVAVGDCKRKKASFSNDKDQAKTKKLGAFPRKKALVKKIHMGFLIFQTIGGFEPYNIFVPFPYYMGA